MSDRTTSRSAVVVAGSGPSRPGPGGRAGRGRRCESSVGARSLLEDSPPFSSWTKQTPILVVVLLLPHLESLPSRPGPQVGSGSGWDATTSCVRPWVPSLVPTVGTHPPSPVTFSVRPRARPGPSVRPSVGLRTRPSKHVGGGPVRVPGAGVLHLNDTRGHVGADGGR